MLATLSTEMPKGKAWVYEEKYDGIRTVAARREGSVRLWSRTLKDLTADFASVTRALDELRAPDAILDGEVVVFDPEGVSRFQLLQRRGMGGRLAYAIFDVLELDGRPLLRMPLRDRRALLEEIVPARRGVLMRSRRVGMGPRAALRAQGPLPLGASAGPEWDPLGEARARGWEGIIAKDETSPYEPGKRTRSWLKIKVRKEAEFVIGGSTAPEGSRAAFGSLILGMYDSDRLRYVGRVGTGFTGDTLRELAAKMRPLVVAKSPFDPPPKVKDPTWVRPRLVAQIAYAEWTSDGRLRQPSFLGLRTDKPSREVRWEEREP
jgi:bifunctional non-homologous end joining protein LigD